MLVLFYFFTSKLKFKLEYEGTARARVHHVINCFVLIPGAGFSKVPGTFRARKASCQTPICLF